MALRPRIVKVLASEPGEIPPRYRIVRYNDGRILAKAFNPALYGTGLGNGFNYPCGICCPTEPNLMCFKVGIPCGCPKDPLPGFYYAPCSQVTTTSVVKVDGACIAFSPGGPSIFVHDISELPGPVHLVGAGTFRSCLDCCEPPTFICPSFCAGCCFIGAVLVPAFSGAPCLDCPGPPTSANVPATSVPIQRNDNTCFWAGTKNLTYHVDCSNSPRPYELDVDDTYSAVMYCGANQLGQPRWIVELGSSLFFATYHSPITGPCPNGPFVIQPGAAPCAPGTITVSCGGNDAPAVWDPSMASRGLGDSVAKGIKRATFGLVKPCNGCGKRQAKLNKLLKYKSKGR